MYPNVKRTGEAISGKVHFPCRGQEYRIETFEKKNLDRKYMKILKIISLNWRDIYFIFTNIPVSTAGLNFKIVYVVMCLILLFSIIALSPLLSSNDTSTIHYHNAFEWNMNTSRMCSSRSLNYYSENSDDRQ